jgi:hypothetical protein
MWWPIRECFKVHHSPYDVIKESYVVIGDSWLGNQKKFKIELKITTSLRYQILPVLTFSSPRKSTKWKLLKIILEVQTNMIIDSW